MLPEVQADPVRILQLFQNLFVNAINYNGPELPRIHVSVEETGPDYRFAVADNGIGIASEHFERIFMPLKTPALRNCSRKRNRTGRVQKNSGTPWRTHLGEINDGQRLYLLFHAAKTS
jgi:light-regulated signal transduction histidine kinase (bacteriophytochrome)